MRLDGPKSDFNRDPDDRFGLALLDYFQGRYAPPLLLHNTYGPPEALPLDGYYYAPDELPEFDVFALSFCQGTVLDIGAAAGRHALALAEAGFQVTAMDISGYCCDVMVERKIGDVIQANIFQYIGEAFDTVLMLMNGIGLVGDLDGYCRLLEKLKNIVKPGGRIIFDSSDLGYLFPEKAKVEKSYYGVMDYSYEYKSKQGSWFKWLYIDQLMASRLAADIGWHTDIIYEDETDTYLAMLRRIRA